MDDQPTQQTPNEQLDLISERLQTELKRFSNIEALGRAVYLSEAEEQLKELQDAKIRFLGKKSEFASLKKIIGRIPTEQRSAFGQMIQQTEARFVDEFAEIESSLSSIIET